MTRDDIIRMAETAVRAIAPPEYADCPVDEALLKEWLPMLERFAALVAAAEREACAKVCDGKVDAEYATGKVDHNEMSWSMACAIAIRARGNNEQG